MFKERARIAQREGKSNSSEKKMGVAEKKMGEKGEGSKF